MQNLMKTVPESLIPIFIEINLKIYLLFVIWCFIASCILSRQLYRLVVSIDIMLALVNLSVGIYGCIGLYSNDYQNYAMQKEIYDDGLYSIIWWMVWIRIFPIIFIIVLVAFLCIFILCLFFMGRQRDLGIHSQRIRNITGINAFLDSRSRPYQNLQE